MKKYRIIFIEQFLENLIMVFVDSSFSELKDNDKSRILDNVKLYLPKNIDGKIIPILQDADEIFYTTSKNKSLLDSIGINNGNYYLSSWIPK